eukprot:ANDGO_04136.mRNA.1 Lactonase drp35
MSVQKICSGGRHLCSPFVDRQGRVFAVSQGTGEILRVDEHHRFEVFSSSGGAPSCIAFDIDNALYVGDFAHCAILTMVEDGSLTEYVKEYESRPFVGPSAIVFDDRANFYFLDSGSFGVTSLGKSSGSLFYVSAEDQILHPILLNCLSQPSGLAIHIHGVTPIVYVAETSTNRILRVVRTPSGVFQSSVFFQFSGRVGPSALACDSRGNIYVSRFEWSAIMKDGEIVVLSPLGVELRKIVVPGAPEISGLHFHEDDGVLYATEASSNMLFKIVV